MRDASVAEIVFGENFNEDDGDDTTEDQEEIDGAGIVKLCSTNSVENFLKDETLLVYLRQLMSLANNCFPNVLCHSCKEKLIISQRFSGSVLYLTWACCNNHIHYRWASQPLLNQNVGAGDLQFASSILISGDGRMDSPGHSAQYCSYTMMDNHTKKIIAITTVDKQEVQRKSSNLEKAAFEKALTELFQHDVKPVEIATDAHPQINALMKNKHPDIKHSHDIWHAAKNIGKKIIAASHKRQCKELANWTKDITNHFWYCCKNAESREEWMDIWCGIIHHVVNEHTWSVSYGTLSPGHCSHGPLEDTRNKEWLKKGSPAHKALKSIVLNKQKLKNIPYYLNFRSTAETENFQNHIIMYSSKRFSFTPPVYKARNILAALDYNAHIDRPLLRNKKDEICYQRTFNRKSSRWTAYPLKEKKKYSYHLEMFRNIILKHLDDFSGIISKVVMSEDDPRRISTHIASMDPPPTRDIIEQHQSRF